MDAHTRLPIKEGCTAARLLARLELSGSVPVRTSVLCGSVGATRSCVWRALLVLERSGAVTRSRVRYAPDRSKCPTCGRQNKGKKGLIEASWLWVPGKYTVCRGALLPRVCLHCEVAFRATKQFQKYCTRACYTSGRRRETARR